MAAKIAKGVVFHPFGLRACLLLGGLGGVVVVGPGCLNRPVVEGVSTTKTNFTAALTQSSVNKIDILFAIDNSGSMGDKQEYLAQAIPDLVQRLVQPNCVDGSGTIYGPSDTNGNCAQGQLEFPPVKDMHVGIVSTSLGDRGGDQCPVTAGRNNDDRAELIERGPNGGPAPADEGASNFLDWFPGGAAPAPGTVPIASAASLESDFADVVQGVGVNGCGIESQLESWYRFLIQPDPYDSIAVDANGQAQWQGVDQTILAQRHDFLRPDSLVAIIVLSDENDSEIDVRSYNGSGWKFLEGSFTPDHGTSICATNPADPGCMSCASAPPGDPNCQPGANAYSAQNDWGMNTNLRHVHMKAKYGVDQVQFPIQRYVLGLTSKTIPDRNGEYPATGGNGQYQGLTNLDCTNPLFAASLPDGSDTDPTTLCNLPKGTRSSGLVFYAHIGGVPHQLLQQDPTNPDSPQKDTLAASDWVSILGNNPLAYDYSGIDPHMIESYQPRPGLPPPTAANNAEPISGREWITNMNPPPAAAVDREYACTFQLAAPRNCADPNVLAAGCDCPAGLASPSSTPPVCDSATPTQQDYAKAYPTIRELLLGKLMGDQGVISSLCPIHTNDNANGDDPLYGYRPAMTSIVNRLKKALASACLPHEVQVDPTTGAVPCSVLVTLPAASSGAGCDASLGFSVPSADVLGPFGLRRDRSVDAHDLRDGTAHGRPARERLLRGQRVTRLVLRDRRRRGRLLPGGPLQQRLAAHGRGGEPPVHRVGRPGPVRAVSRRRRWVREAPRA